MSDFIEIGTYTAGTQEYADEVLKNIDENNVIKHKFYRQDCLFDKNGKTLIKDINFVYKKVRQNRRETLRAS
jgi:TFIIF-interacting CTD phosphatase-like protein